MMFKSHAIASLVLVGAFAGCAGAKVGISPSGGNSGNGGGGGGAGSGLTVNLDAKAPSNTPEPDQGAVPQACDNPSACTDFPKDPILDGNVPANPGSQFSGSPSGSGPCVIEPEDGSLFPYNWLRPRIKWSGASGLVQITIHADLEANDLVAYTTSDHWLMPKDVWKALSKHVHEQDVAVTVRAAGGGATTAKFQIASANAAGNIVFWAADPAAAGNQNIDVTPPDTDSMLKGFSVGEDNTVDALLLSQVQQPSMAQSFNKRTPKCMGCHAATPDKGYVAFVDHWPWNAVISNVTKALVGTQLTNLNGGGLAALNKPWAGASTFSAPFWQSGDRRMVTTSAQSSDSTPWSTDDKLPAKLVWYNLDSPTPSTKVNDGYQCVPGTQYGVISRNGDSNGAAFPTWSHDGNTIVYSSTNGGCMDGRLEQGATDLYSVPFNKGDGGDAKPLPGASEKAFEEYYAAFSSDDQLVLFDRVPSGQVMYANPNAEVYFVPVGSAPGSGKAIRLDANDPPTCMGKPSPGINNHFPKWAPAKADYNGRSYYWVIFSSNRLGLPKVKSKYDGKEREVSQLYLTAISVENGQYKTYRSIYLWNQSAATLNTTPVWDIIDIPPAQPIY